MTDARVSKTALSALVKPAPDAQVSKTALSVLVKVNGAGSTADATLTLSAAGAVLASAAGAGSLSLSGSGSAHHPATSYPEYVLDGGPVGYWRLGESSGDTAVDSSGNGNDGTFTYASSSDVVHGVAGAIAGDTDTATRFRLPGTGTTPAMNAPSSIADTFTFEGWFDGRAVMSGDHAGGTGPSPVQVEISSGSIFVRIADGLHFNSGTEVPVIYGGTIPALTAGYHYLAATRDVGGTLTIYLDDALLWQFTGTVSPKSGAATFYLEPAHTAGGVEYVSADEVALYDHALTGTEVATHYALGHGSEGGASLTLSASGTVTGLSAAGIASLSLSATGQVPTPAAGEGFLELSGDGAAAGLYATDTSNLLNGRVRRARATSTVDRPIGAPASNLGTKYDKAVPLPPPTLVNGRVT